jgi:putative peptidoglycan lipid II flippase|tara:strand:+ start:267 stop:1808 length:1542 start_codon:yes stop_codon:yes gene_type:complete
LRKTSNLFKSFFTVGAWTILSRIFGFIRDIFIAIFLGSGPVAEAFLIAFSLPNMFRSFFAEGALNLSFVPIFSKKLNNKNDAKLFAENTLSYLMIILIVFTIFAQIFMPWLIYAMASGFYEDERFNLTVTYAKITFPYIFFISVTALLSGVMNSLGSFVAAAAAPILLNLTFILSMFLANYFGLGIGISLAWAVPIAGIIQMLLLWITASRLGFKLIPKFSKLTPDLRRLFRVAGPAVLSGGVIQINLLVGRQVASYYEGGIAWLSYADRIYQLPLGVVGITIGVVLLPNLAKKLANNDNAGSQISFNRSLEFSLIIALPSAIALIVMPNVIISALFERGAFSSLDTLKTAAALTIYGIGLPAFIGQKIYQPIFYARENTRSPFYFALVAMAVNLTLAVSLAQTFGYLASALGTTIASWTMLLLLKNSSKKYGPATQIDSRNKRVIPRVVIASLIMGSLLLITNHLLSMTFFDVRNKYVVLLIMMFAGGFSYILIGQLIGAFSIKEIKSYFKK